MSGETGPGGADGSCGHGSADVTRAIAGNVRLAGRGAAWLLSVAATLALIGSPGVASGGVGVGGGSAARSTSSGLIVRTYSVDPLVARYRVVVAGRCKASFLIVFVVGRDEIVAHSRVRLLRDVEGGRLILELSTNGCRYVLQAPQRVR